jgi:non-homologous end joining protein Ku
MPKEMLSLASHILDTKSGHFNPEFETATGSSGGIG